jgi:hypothetical protein
MAYVKLAIYALSAVILLSLGSAKSELSNKSQIQPSGEVRASQTFQSKRSEKMSPTLGLRQCKNYGESCTYDGECCSNSCNAFGGNDQCGGDNKRSGTLGLGHDDAGLTMPVDGIRDRR